MIMICFRTELDALRKYNLIYLRGENERLAACLLAYIKEMVCHLYTNDIHILFNS